MIFQCKISRYDDQCVHAPRTHFWRVHHRQTVRQADRQTDTDRQTNRQTVILKDRPTDDSVRQRQTDTIIYLRRKLKPVVCTK